MGDPGVVGICWGGVLEEEGCVVVGVLKGAPVGYEGEFWEVDFAVSLKKDYP